MQIQREDQGQKFNARNEKSNLYKSVEFENKNVLSYLYQKKVHKAHQYSQRNEQIFNVMKEKFGGTFQKGGNKDDEDRFNREQDEKNKAFDEMIHKRANDRFVKEMETRKFVDEQIRKNKNSN